MQGWTLADVRDLDEDEYAELVQWLVESDKDHDDDSVDVDELMEARRKAREEADKNGG